VAHKVAALSRVIDRFGATRGRSSNAGDEQYEEEHDTDEFSLDAWKTWLDTISGSEESESDNLDLIQKNQTMMRDFMLYCLWLSAYLQYKSCLISLYTVTNEFSYY